MIRVVLDTNIIISYTFLKGNPHEVVRRGISGEYQLVASAEILDEAANKLRTKFKFPEESIQELANIIRSYAVLSTEASLSCVSYCQETHRREIVSG